MCTESVCRYLESTMQFAGDRWWQLSGCPIAKCVELMESWLRGRPATLASEWASLPCWNSEQPAALRQNRPAAGHVIYPGTRPVLSYISSPCTSEPQAGQPWARAHTGPSLRLLLLVPVYVVLAVNSPRTQWLSSQAVSMQRQGRHKQWVLLMSKTKLKPR